MSKSAWVFAATTLVTGIVAMHLWQQLRLFRRSINYPAAALSCPLQAQTAATSATPLAALPAVVEAGQAQTTPPASSHNCSSTPVNVLDRLMPRLNKETKERLRIQVRKGAAGAYPDLAKELDFTAAEYDAFLDLLGSQFDIRNNVPDSYTGTDEALRLELQNTHAELPKIQAAEIEALLGPYKYARWKEYQPTIAARNLLNSWRSIGPMPSLTAEQKRLLIAPVSVALNRAKEVMSAGQSSALSRQESSEVNLKAAEVQYNAILEGAQVYLSAQQFSELKSALAQMLNNQRASVAAARARQSGDVGQSPSR